MHLLRNAFLNGRDVFTRHNTANNIVNELEAFSAGEGMKFMPFAAESMADFMVSVGFIPEKPDMSKLFDDSFIKKVAAS